MRRRRGVENRLSALTGSTNGNDPYQNRGKPWFPEDDARLAGLYQSGKSIPELAALFQRSRTNIEYRLQTLGLYERETR